MPEISAAETIIVLTLPPAAGDIICSRNLEELEDDEVKRILENGLNRQLYEPGEQQKAMDDVSSLVGKLTQHQNRLLLDGLQHVLSEEDGHHGSVHFLQLNSDYEIAGVGLELRDDTVTEEEVSSPLRVMFVRWGSRTSSPSA